MGMVSFGIPERIVLEMRDVYGVSVFVETGTYQGATALWAAKHFEQVFTIEYSESLYRQHAPMLSDCDNVTALCGDSRTLLPDIVNGLGEKRALYWLDSHWFGGETAGHDEQCPLLAELACLWGRPQDIVLIDDARLFLAPPPMPHDPAQWPDFGEIIRALPDAGRGRTVYVADDVIYVIPAEEPLRSRLLAYTKRRNNLFWQDYRDRHHSDA